MEKEISAPKAIHRGTPWWIWVVIIFWGLLGIATTGWCISRRLNDEYLQMNRLGPISLQPIIPEVWLTVDYPHMLSKTDQGTQRTKRIVVQLGLNPGYSDREISLGIKLVDTGIRLLNEKGDPVSGKVQLNVTQETNPIVFYVEHTRIRSDPPFSAIFELLPPTSGITVSHPVPASTFTIQEETAWHQVFRQLLPPAYNITTWLAGLWGIGSTLIGLVKKRHTQMDDLYRKAREHVDQGNIEGYRPLYREYEQLRWPRQTSFHLIVHREFEELDQVAEEQCRNVQERKAREEEQKREKAKRKAELYAWILKALEQDDVDQFRAYLDELNNLDSQYQDIGLFETIYHLEQERQKLKSGWSFPENIAGKSELEKGLASTEPVIRRWAVRLLAHFDRDPGVGKELRRLLRDDPSLDVRAEAAWALSRQERNQSAVSQLATPDQVTGWLQRFSFAYNPFSLITAEQEMARWQNQHFVEHPAYDCLESSAGHTALFADAGCGKTSFRLQFQRHLQENAHVLIVEYVDFSPWMPWDWNVIPSPRVHTERIIERIISLTGWPQDIVPLHLPYAERLQRLADRARQNGYPDGIRVLVDKVDAGHDARQDPTVAEHLIRDLMDTWDMLTIDGLRFHFFLPLTLFERTAGYETLSAGLIEKIRAEWTAEQLRALLERRLVVASNGKINSLNALAELLEGIEWDAIVTELTNGSPRRLIRLVNLLFRHRAGIAGKGKIQAIDWACLYERFASGEI